MYKNFYQNKKILVTGATGFKGSWLCLWLNMLGAKVFGVGYTPNENKKLFNQLKLEKKIKVFDCDIKNFKELNKIINKTKPVIIFHMAAKALIHEGYKKPFETYMVNTVGTLNILEIIKNCKFVRSVVCITSDKCYQSNNSTKGFVESDKLGGEDPYSGSKASAEIIINTYFKSFFMKKKNIGLASTRAGNVIGGGDWSKNRLIPDCIKSLKKNRIIFIRNPNFNRPWQHVLEPLNGYLILGMKLFNSPKKYSGAWNFGSNEKKVTSVLTIVKQIIKIWGKGKLKYSKKKKYYEQTNLQLNILKANRLLKWHPKLSIANSVKMTVNWYKLVMLKKDKPAAITEKQIIDYMNEK